VEAMLRHTASFATSYEIIEEKAEAGPSEVSKPQPVGAGVRWPGNFAE